MLTDLRDYLSRLESRGEVIHVEESLSTRYEIAAALKMFDSKQVLVFDDVRGYEGILVGGVCGTRGRLLDALNVSASNLYPRLLEAGKNPVTCKVGDGPVKEVIVNNPTLGDFPILTHFLGDPGPYITSGIVYAKSPDGSVENVSLDQWRMYPSTAS